MTKKILTLCLVHKHPHVLLGMKKRGFGMGKWNGFGGKVQPEETIELAAIREVKEEANIDIDIMEKVGVINFNWENNPETLEVHLFRAENFRGQPVESEEMMPQWYHVDEIPFNDMWPDDAHWMPLLFAGKKFQGKFLFDNKNNIIQHELNEVIEV